MYNRKKKDYSIKGLLDLNKQTPPPCGKNAEEEEKNCSTQIKCSGAHGPTMMKDKTLLHVSEEILRKISQHLSSL